MRHYIMMLGLRIKQSVSGTFLCFPFKCFINDWQQMEYTQSRVARNVLSPFHYWERRGWGRGVMEREKLSRKIVWILKKRKSKFKLTEVCREHSLNAKASLHPEKQLHQADPFLPSTLSTHTLSSEALIYKHCLTVKFMPGTKPLQGNHQNPPHQGIFFHHAKQALHERKLKTSVPDALLQAWYAFPLLSCQNSLRLLSVPCKAPNTHRLQRARWSRAIREPFSHLQHCLATNRCQETFWEEQEALLSNSQKYFPFHLLTCWHLLCFYPQISSP